jgi:rubrerythrin
MQKRKLGESQKKIIAASQAWKCKICEAILSAAYQIDHIIPLWNGGLDSMENLQAICPSCHATKTQKESIERAKMRVEEKQRRAMEAQKQYEETVRKEEYAKMTIYTLVKGKQCSECFYKFYGIFKHDTCPKVEDKIHERLHPKKKKTDDDGENPFLRFLYTGHAELGK